MGYTVFQFHELEWEPRREGDPRLVSELSHALTSSRANLYRYPPGAVGRRHIDPVQEEVFVVLAGTLTIHMGEGDNPERHELGPVAVVDDQRDLARPLARERLEGRRRVLVLPLRHRPAGYQAPAAGCPLPVPCSLFPVPLKKTARSPRL